MEYKPKGETKRSDLIIVGLFILGVVCFGAAKLTGRYVFISQAAGLLALCASIYFAVRFRLTQFVYTLSYDGDDEIFTVFRDRGRRKAALCAVSATFLRSVKRYESREVMKDATAGCDVYNYTQSMTPETYVLLVFDTTGERDLAVIVECDAAFERELAKRVS